MKKRNEKRMRAYVLGLKHGASFERRRAKAAIQKRAVTEAISIFLNDSCDRNEFYRVGATPLYHRFTEWWAEKRGGAIPTVTMFGRVVSLLHPKFKHNGNIVYLGLNLL